MLGRRFRAWRLARISVRRWPGFVGGNIPGSRARRLRRVHALGQFRVSWPPSAEDIPQLHRLCRVGYIRAVPMINLTDDELAAVAAAIRRLVDEDKFPRAPRLGPLRAALGKFDAAAEPTPDPKGVAGGEGGKRARR
jgi:hypothetical protein